MFDIKLRKYMKATEPWLYSMNPMSIDLENEVIGFINFLDQKLIDTTKNQSYREEIMSKRLELMNWRSIIDMIRPLKRYGENYLDFLHIPSEPFKLLYFNGQVVLSLLNTIHDECYADSSSKSQIAVGFLLKKCLRKVACKTEAREIYRATRCDVDLTRKYVLREYPEEYIIKRVAKSTSVELTKRLKREFKTHYFMSKFNHEGVNTMTSYCEDETSFYSISCSAGQVDLLDALQDNIEVEGKTFSEDRIKKMFKKAIEGLVIAHNLGIAHRDISLENFCLNDREFLEVIDWGHSCSTNGKYVAHTGVIGKERYFAPELLHRTVNYDPFKADVFSLGVCLFSAFTGQMPFTKHGDTRSRILSKGCELLLKGIQKNSKPSTLSENAIDLLKGCLKWNVSERLTMKEVLDHDFFRI